MYKRKINVKNIEIIKDGVTTNFDNFLKDGTFFVDIEIFKHFSNLSFLYLTSCLIIFRNTPYFLKYKLFAVLHSMHVFV